MVETLSPAHRLPSGSVAHRPLGWWAMWCLIATEASLFAYLLFSYFYLASQAHGQWLPELPKLRTASINTFLLLTSSLVLRWGEKGIIKGKCNRLLLGLGGTFILGSIFFVLQLIEWSTKKYTLSDSAYASSYFVTTGFHMAHVALGLLAIAVLFLWTLLGKFDAQHHAPVSIGGLYWHFVDVVWLAVFTTYYLLPYFHR